MSRGVAPYFCAVQRSCLLTAEMTSVKFYTSYEYLPACLPACLVYISHMFAWNEG
jgi:hypothetical protein